MMKMLDNGRGILAMCILAAMLFSSLLVVSVARAQEEQTAAITSDKSIYKLGETVVFTFSGLEPSQEYALEISRGERKFTVTFTTDEDGRPIGDVSWSTSGAEPGTYSYALKIGTEELGGGRLGIVGINKERFAIYEEIIISGGGASPGGEVTATLRINGSAIVTVSGTADENGEFELRIMVSYEVADGDYSVVVSVSGILVEFGIKIETTPVQFLDGLLGTVSGIDAPIVDSLVAKLNNAKKKVEAADELLAEGKIHVARNMLRAARNMLTAFIHEVRAQRGKHLDEATADSLIGAAQKLIERIESLMLQLDHRKIVETTSVPEKSSRGGGKDKNEGGKDKNNETHGKKNNDNHKRKK